MLFWLVFWLWLAYMLTKLCKFVFNQVRLYRALKDLPGPEIRVPLLGHFTHFWSGLRSLTDLENDSVEIMNKVYHRYDNEHGIVRMWMGPAAPMVFITDIKLARKLFSNNFYKSSQYTLLNFVYGTDSFLTCNESQYKKHRNSLSQHFKVKALDSYLCKTMTNLDELNRFIDDRLIDRKDGFLSSASEIISPFVFQSLAENLFSTKFNSIATQKMPCYIEANDELISMFNLYSACAYTFKSRIFVLVIATINQIFVRRLSQCKLIWHIFVGFAQMILDTYRRLKNAQNVPEELSFFESLVLTNIVRKKSYYEKICGYFYVFAHGEIFMLAGYASTSAALSYILYNLAKYPDVQKKLIDEIDNFQQLLSSNGEKMTYLSLKRLKYMDAVIKESIRLHSPANYIGRTISTPEVINDQISIPPNVDIVISLQNIFKSAKYFRDPERFYPQRHLEPAESPLESAATDWFTEMAYIPFSMGVRICPGRDYSLMQIKLYLINLLSKYSIELHDEVDHSVHKDITIMSLRNFSWKIYKRI